MDAKALLNKFDSFTAEERGALTATLDKDLSKVLGVAKEIENAKDLIDKYHANANRNNFETLKKENPKDKK